MNHSICLRVFVLACALAWAGCAAHGRDNAVLTDVEAPHLPHESNAKAAADSSACEIPTDFSPALRATVPDIAGKSENLNAELLNVHIDLGKDGSIRVNTTLKLRNTGTAPANTAVGYLLRTPVGQERRFLQISFETAESGKLKAETCQRESPENAARPYVDWASFAAFQVEPGGFFEIGTSYQTGAEATATPSTLFGYRDLFAFNWKNWSWTYARSAEFKEIADELDFFYGTFELKDADRIRVEIRAEPESGGLRGLSHEQNLEALPERDAYVWSFNRQNRPSKIEFEYSRGTVTAAREAEIFARMTTARPNDLRAMIHLADLYLFNGTPEKRARILASLLDAWDANAKEQLLLGRNDLLPAAYVGLVKTMAALGKSENARAEAEKGAESARRLLAGGDGAEEERAALAAKWLEEKAHQRIQ